VSSIDELKSSDAREKITKRVLSVVSEYLDINIESITLESSFQNDLGADSLDTVELVMAFEEEFGIDIPDEEAEKINTVQHAVLLIEKRREEVTSS